jgi:hypothetical protein
VIFKSLAVVQYLKLSIHKRLLYFVGGNVFTMSRPIQLVCVMLSWPHHTPTLLSWTNLSWPYCEMYVGCFAGCRLMNTSQILQSTYDYERTVEPRCWHRCLPSSYPEIFVGWINPLHFLDQAAYISFSYGFTYH